MYSQLEIQPRLNCPNCWQQLEPADLLWISSHPDLRGDAYLGADALKRFLPSRFDVEGFALDAKGTRCQTLACPQCHLPVPRILVETKPTFVSVLGSPASGKSYFLAAAVWEIRKKLGHFQVNFADADPVANRVLSEYESKLFLNDRPDQFVAIPKTQTEGESYQLVNYPDRDEIYARPFVFSLRPSESHVALRGGGDVRRTSRALCLYDNAGEHFVPELASEISPATDHLALSEALIFVLDPLQHPKFRQLCRLESSDPQLGSSFRCWRQDEILLEAAKRIRQKANLAQHEHFDKPLVVAVNKYDVWKHLIPEVDFRQKSPYQRLKDGTIGLNLSMIKAVSDRIRLLLEEHAREIVAACTSFSKDVAFMPVSPQGCSPIKGEDEKLGVLPEQIKPVWAEVPLIYALCRSKCGLIPAIVGRDSPKGREIAEVKLPEDQEAHPPRIFKEIG